MSVGHETIVQQVHRHHRAVRPFLQQRPLEQLHGVSPQHEIPGYGEAEAPDAAASLEVVPEAGSVDPKAGLNEVAWIVRCRAALHLWWQLSEDEGGAIQEKSRDAAIWLGLGAPIGGDAHDLPIRRKPQQGEAVGVGVAVAVPGALVLLLGDQPPQHYCCLLYTSPSPRE